MLQGPDPEADGVSTWRLIDLCQIVQERFGVSYSETGMGKLMRGLDLSWQTPRPRHAETDRVAQERFKKGASRKPLRRSRSCPEAWCSGTDSRQVRVGQAATAGSLTCGSSLKAARPSSVM